ncbi:MAG: PilZ domain-containing protein [Candidatus Omnitrophica bacterium]|nr:PilZ domain-containing protein [Candidatus Omnitrophota bacterium]
MSSLDRRKYPRISESIPCQIAVGSSSFVAETKNLSCGGASCQLPQPLPLMTKLEVILNLPPSESSSSRPIRILGVVVRQEPASVSGGSASYLTAIYFSEIQLEDRRRIAEFVLQSMLSHDRRRS